MIDVGGGGGGLISDYSQSRSRPNNGFFYSDSESSGFNHITHREETIKL